MIRLRLFPRHGMLQCGTLITCSRSRIGDLGDIDNGSKGVQLYIPLPQQLVSDIEGFALEYTHFENKLKANGCI